MGINAVENLNFHQKWMKIFVIENEDERIFLTWLR